MKLVLLCAIAFSSLSAHADILSTDHKIKSSIEAEAYVLPAKTIQIMVPSLSGMSGSKFEANADTAKVICSEAQMSVVDYQTSVDYPGINSSQNGTYISFTADGAMKVRSASSVRNGASIAWLYSVTCRCKTH